MTERTVSDVIVERLGQWGLDRINRPTVIEVLTDPDVPLLPPFPAGRERLPGMRAALDEEGTAGRHARALLDEYAAHEGG